MDGVLLTDYPMVTTYAVNQTVELSAIPAEGYRFTGWSGSYVGAQETVSITVSCTKNVTATFEPIRYRLITIVSPAAGGTIMVEPQQPTSGYIAGTKVAVRAMPATGYSFKEWSGGASGEVNTVSIISDSDKSITATFVNNAIDTSPLVVDVSPVNSGTVEINGATPAEYPATTVFPVDNVVHLTAVPKAGYSFSGWRDGSEEKTETITLMTTTSARNIIATFEPVRYRIITNVLPPAAGSITLNPPQPLEGYVAGTRVTIQAEPAPGYTFDAWAGDLSEADDKFSIIADGEQSMTANFIRESSSSWIWGGATLFGVALVGMVIYFLWFKKRIRIS
jgi:uncharacterized repeat protein (TIGR02543 family)